jgi:membrane fusion protein (multidrug efflux system)
MSQASAPVVKVKWWKSARSKTIGKVTLGLGLVGVVIWWFFFHPYVSTDDARVATTLVHVGSQGAAGRIEKINVEEGTRVKRGDILAELDHRAAEAALEGAQAHLGLANHDYKRASQLSAQHGLSARDLDKAQSEALAAEAQLKLAQVALDNTSLRSTIDGVVVQKTIEVGDILEPGQTAFTVADIDGAWISANIEETSIGDVKIGQPVKISIDEGGRLTGKVIEIRQAAAAQFALIPSDNAAGNFTKLVQRIPIKVGLDPHPGRSLRVGQSVEIKIRVR